MKFNLLSIGILGAVLLHQASAVDLQRAHRPDRGDNEEQRSDDIYKGDQGDKATAKMSEFDKMSEDNYHQGHHNTGQTNDGNHKSPKHNVPYADEKLGPRNTPKHVGHNDHAKPLITSASPTGIEVVHLTVPNEEKARRFIKQLLSKGMIASAELEKDGKVRHFLKMGKTATETDIMDLAMVTTDRRLQSLINFIHKHGPTDYDYPVADIQVEPVTHSDAKYTKWVKYQTR